MKQSDFKKFKIGTRIIRATSHVDFNVKSHVPPIFQTVNYEYENAEDGFAVFNGAKQGYIYTRDGNPNTDHLAELVALLEEGEMAATTASGMAAISSAILSLVKPGDHIVSSKFIYGGTRAWLEGPLNDQNISSSFVNILDEQEIISAITPATKILYAEVLANPNLIVADLDLLSKIANKNNLVLIIDNTFTPPPIIQPLKYGADLVIHSATKYLGGHGDIIGGVIVGSAGRIQNINKIIKLYGGVSSPFNAWLAMRGLKTLAVRLDNHCRNALKVAEFLDKHPKVNQVYYPGLASHPQHKLAARQLNGFGGMLAFEIKGDFSAVKRIMDAVKVFNFTVSLGEIDSLIMHPASTSHVSLSDKDKKALGITDSLIRLSIGIEDSDDLIYDLEQALELI